MDRTSNPAPDAPQSDCLRDRIKPIYDDPCVERGTTIAFGAPARAEAQKAVQEIIATLASARLGALSSQLRRSWLAISRLASVMAGGSAIIKVAVGSRPSGKS
jgi:hypothetical protein